MSYALRLSLDLLFPLFQLKTSGKFQVTIQSKVNRTRVHPQVSGEPLLEIRDLKKSYPGVIALDALDLELVAGEVHILLGENGAGKSTLVKILGGGVAQDSGTISVSGSRQSQLTPRLSRQLGISIIYQELNLVPQLSAAENIFLGEEPESVPGVIDKRFCLESAERLLQSLGVQINPRKPCKGLTLAEQQMVEIARALRKEARILIMDEPTSALSDREAERLFSTIKRLKRQGVGIIYISHRLEEVLALGDRVTVLRDGQKVGTFPIGEIRHSDLVRLMVGREIHDYFPKRTSQLGSVVLSIERLQIPGLPGPLTFQLRAGEVLGVAGLMGAGRTLLARGLFGLIPGISGGIRVQGQSIRRISPAGAMRHGICYLSEDRKRDGLVPSLSVSSNISLSNMGGLSRLGWILRHREAGLARKMIQRLRIKTPDTHQRVGLLSGGNQQKVILSKWLAREPLVMILDEPTRGIDVGAKSEIYGLINGLVAEGRGILLISSDISELLGMSDRILVMRAGRLVGCVIAQESSRLEILRQALGSGVDQEAKEA